MVNHNSLWDMLPPVWRMYLLPISRSRSRRWRQVFASGY